MAADPQAGAMPPVLANLVYNRPPGYFTDADLDALPESYRYEIVDGTLVVSPRPSVAHQRAAAMLFDRLRATRPDGVDVLYEVDYKPVEQRTLVPDIVVAPTGAFSEKALVGAPLLVVEVRSPSSRTYDWSLKRAIYAEAGVPTYWLVDPEGPSLTVLELDDTGEYVEVARVSGDEELRVLRPYPVSIRLS